MHTLSALSFPELQVPPVTKWIAVRQRCEQFYRNLSLTVLQQQDAHTKRAGVVGCLNRHYYGTSSTTDNSFVIGSWGKGTSIRPPRDIDLYFVLPVNVHHRFQVYFGNRQSALLQEVKKVLADTYPETDMRGDGQVVVVKFDSFDVEVAPAFLLTNGRYWICDTNDGPGGHPNSPREPAFWAHDCFNHQLNLQLCSGHRLE